jgi:hypothetical protein
MTLRVVLLLDDPFCVPTCVTDAPSPLPTSRRLVASVGVLAGIAAFCGLGAYAIGPANGGPGGVVAMASAYVDPSAPPWSAATLSPGPSDPSDQPDTSAPVAADPAPQTAAADVPVAAESVVAADAALVAPADRQAGIATTDVVQAGTGRLVVVGGSFAAPLPGPSWRVRIEVEDGIGADRPAFAAFVMATLNDPRSWGHGEKSFARTDGPADIRVILASPDTSARLCAPLKTLGTVSCGTAGRAVLTMYRWMDGTPDYAKDLTGYRHYVVNHEVGHALGHSHAFCTPGHLAPVMVQQTRGLLGCLPNAWPFPRS